VKDRDVKKEKPRPAPPPLPQRRDFLTRALTIIVGGIITLFPFAAGLAVFVDPLRRKGKKGEFVPVAELDEVPADGVPRQFKVAADQSDAWNFYPNEPLGAVYLRRVADADKPEAVTATCPHLGCFVDFYPAAGTYKCPCHDSSFEADGKRINPETCPAARDLDSLEVEVRDGTVWVEFQKFKPGIKDKVIEE
jgi:menaquinol-cytochrome c reductase iron-sulfur subunit